MDPSRVFTKWSRGFKSRDLYHARVHQWSWVRCSTSRLPSVVGPLYFLLCLQGDKADDAKSKTLLFTVSQLVELAQIVSAVSFIVIHILKEIELFKNTAKLQVNIF